MIFPEWSSFSELSSIPWPANPAAEFARQVLRGGSDARVPVLQLGVMSPLSTTGQTTTPPHAYNHYAILPSRRPGIARYRCLEAVMNKTLKIVLVVVGVLVVLVLVAPFLIPVNQFRPSH